MTLTIVDIVVLSVIFLSAIISLFRGFVKEILSLVGMVVSTILTIALHERVEAYLLTQMDNPLMAKGIAVVGLFILFSIIFIIINSFIVRTIRSSDFSGLDRSLGLLFGLLRGAFLISLCYMVVTTLMKEDDYPKALKEAKTLGVMKLGSDVLKNMAPEYTKELEVHTKETKKDMEDNAKQQLTPKK